MKPYGLEHYGGPVPGRRTPRKAYPTPQEDPAREFPVPASAPASAYGRKRARREAALELRRPD